MTDKPLVPWQKRENPLAYNTDPGYVRQWVDAQELLVGDQMVIDHRGETVMSAPARIGGNVRFTLSRVGPVETERVYQFCVDRPRKGTVR